MPVAARLLLILPDGELYDYLCRGCGQAVGQKRETSAAKGRIVLP